MSTDTYTVGPGQFTIGEDTDLTVFSGQVTSLKLTPNVDKDDPIDVLDGGSVPGDRKETWKVNGSMLQDLGATESRQEWLYAHAGEEHAFTYVPNTARGRKITGTLQVEAIEFGGDAKTKPISDFEFDCTGARPVITNLAP